MRIKVNLFLCSFSFLENFEKLENTKRVYNDRNVRCARHKNEKDATREDKVISPPYRVKFKFC